MQSKCDAGAPCIGGGGTYTLLLVHPVLVVVAHFVAGAPCGLHPSTSFAPSTIPPTLQSCSNTLLFSFYSYNVLTSPCSFPQTPMNSIHSVCTMYFWFATAWESAELKLHQPTSLQGILCPPMLGGKCKEGKEGWKVRLDLD